MSFEFAIGDRLPYVHLLGASGDVPVDSANVVTRLVGPRLARLRAVARRDPLVVAVENSVEPPVDLELELKPAEA